jgi:hypothetical protein
MTGRQSAHVRPMDRAGLLVRLHRDERGGMLDYAFIMIFVALLLWAPIVPGTSEAGHPISIPEALWGILAEYFGMIAYYVTWPFL